MDIDPNFTTKKSIITEIMAVLGIIGNIISFIVFSRPTFQKNSVSIYFRALAIFDMFIIYSAILDFYYIFYEYFIPNYSNSVCVACTYSYYTLGSITGWILISFSIDRVQSLKKVTNTMKRPIVHYSVIIAIFLVLLLLYIEIPIYLRLSPIEIYGTTFYVCDPSLLPFGKVINIIYIVDGSILPFVIMTISSLVTIKLLRDSRSHVGTFLMADNKRKNRDNKFAITSLAFNFLFIVLKMPLVIVITIGYNFVNYYFLQIAILLFFLDYSIKFFVHFVSNCLFRRELFILLRIRKPKTSSIGQNNR